MTTTPPHIQRKLDEAHKRIAELENQLAAADKLADACEETITVVDECYQSTGHIRLAAGSHQRNRITGALDAYRAARKDGEQ